MVQMLKPKIASLDLRVAKPAAKRVDAELSTPEHRAWRAEVLRRAGDRCEQIENGQRCTVTKPARLFADHIKERRDGGNLLDPENGQCLCGRHHTLKTARVRAERMREKF